MCVHDRSSIVWLVVILLGEVTSLVFLSRQGCYDDNTRSRFSTIHIDSRFSKIDSYQSQNFKEIT